MRLVTACGDQIFFADLAIVTAPPKPRQSKRIGTIIRTNIFIFEAPSLYHQKQHRFACVQTIGLAGIGLSLALLGQEIAEH